jgi:hypothetical protein
VCARGQCVVTGPCSDQRTFWTNAIDASWYGVGLTVSRGMHASCRSSGTSCSMPDTRPNRSLKNAPANVCALLQRYSPRQH